MQRIRQQSPVPYKAVFVPEDMAANAVFINGRVICKSEGENPASHAIWREKLENEVVGVDCSELEKANGSLTCMSLRFNTPKRVAPIKWACKAFVE